VSEPKPALFRQLALVFVALVALAEAGLWLR
jgi:hypothetical protein